MEAELTSLRDNLRLRQHDSYALYQGTTFSRAVRDVAHEGF